MTFAIARVIILILPAVLVLGSLGFLLGEAVFLSERERDVGRWLLSDMLPHVSINTLVLVAWVVAGALLGGIFQAFVVTYTNVPWKKWLHVLFILPLSFPLYVTAFVYVGLFDGGSVLAVAGVFVLSLSPYVYLLARGAFQEVGMSMVRSGRMLGCSPSRVFFQGILPCSRPWLFAAAALVALETMADFGAVAVFNYDTLTTAIYNVWKSFFSLSLAALMALLLAVVALALFWWESRLFKRGTFVATRNPGESTTLFHFSPRVVCLLMGVCLGWITLSLLVPLGQLSVWGWRHGWEDVGEGRVLWNTFRLALTGGGLVSLWALGMNVLARGENSFPARFLRHSALLGYALPGTLIGVALFAFFSKGLSLSAGQGGLLLLWCGYSVRFLNVAFRPLNAAIDAMPMGRERSARMLGADEKKLVGRVYLPYLKGFLLTSFLLSFVEIAKEMPMTLILRSPEQATLAVKIYELTSEGEWERAAPFGMVLVGMGMVSLVLLSRLEERTIS